MQGEAKMIKTMTLRVETPLNRTLHILLPPDVPDGPLEVVLVIVAAAPVMTPRPSLAGHWQAYFPADFDLERALHDLRHEWEKDQSCTIG